MSSNCIAEARARCKEVGERAAEALSNGAFDWGLSFAAAEGLANAYLAFGQACAELTALQEENDILKTQLYDGDTNLVNYWHQQHQIAENCIRNYAADLETAQTTLATLQEAVRWRSPGELKNVKGMMILVERRFIFARFHETAFVLFGQVFSRGRDITGYVMRWMPIPGSAAKGVKADG